MKDIQFSDAEKEEKQFEDKYFRLGVHQVQIAGIVIDEDDQERGYIEIGVVDPLNENLNTEVRMWLHTEGARSFTFNTLRQIYVHNAPDDQKDKARDTFNAIKDVTELGLILEKLNGGTAWIKVAYDLSGRTYQNAKGETKKSITTNIFGYEPKLKPGEVDDGQQPLQASDYAEGDVPFGTAAEEAAKKNASGTVPSKW